MRESNRSIIENYNKVNAPEESAKVVGEPADNQEQKVETTDLYDNGTFRVLTQEEHSKYHGGGTTNSNIKEDARPIVILTSMQMKFVGEEHSYKISDNELFIERLDSKSGHPLKINFCGAQAFANEIKEIMDTWEKQVFSIE